MLVAQFLKNQVPPNNCKLVLLSLGMLYPARKFVK